MDPQSYIPDEMIRRYVERRRADLRLVEDAIQKKDRDTLIRVGHQIKGNAATFTFKDLEMIGIRLEESALAGDFMRASEISSDFKEWLLAQGS
jgi:HPt (histidine-containing phosphotransfer) domain-containing protein